MVRVKVCGITNLGDALAAIAAGADELGFNFYPRSPRYIEPRKAREIIARLPPGVLSVGVFVDEESGAVKHTVGVSDVGAAQLHGSESPAYCESLPGVRLIKALRVGAGFAPESAAEFAAEAILLESFSASGDGGTGRTFDWAVARRTRQFAPRLYLAGGLTPENVAAAISEVSPYAVDVCSGVEARPGRKDPARVSQFFAAVRSAGKET